MSGTFKLLVALLFLTVAACSGSSGESASTSGPSSGAATETSAAGATTMATDTAAADSTTTAGPTGNLSVDPCALLTAADITAATGVEFGEGTTNAAVAAPERAACDWISTGSEFATAQVFIVDAGPGQFEAAMADATDFYGLTTDPVSVPGADNSYATAEGSIVAMDIGGIFLQVSYIPSGPGTVLDETLQLAAIAAGRMP